MARNDFEDHLARGALGVGLALILSSGALFLLDYETHETTTYEKIGLWLMTNFVGGVIARLGSEKVARNWL